MNQIERVAIAIAKCSGYHGGYYNITHVRQARAIRAMRSRSGDTRRLDWMIKRYSDNKRYLPSSVKLVWNRSAIDAAMKAERTARKPKGGRK